MPFEYAFQVVGERLMYLDISVKKKYILAGKQYKCSLSVHATYIFPLIISLNTYYLSPSIQKLI